jgi:hypothetical protein
MTPTMQPLAGWMPRRDDELVARAREFHSQVARRRSVREFDTRPVPREVIEHALRAAGTRYRHCDVPESVGTASACW